MGNSPSQQQSQGGSSQKQCERLLMPRNESLFDGDSSLYASAFALADAVQNESYISSNSQNLTSHEKRPTFSILPSQDLRKLDQAQLTQYKQQKLKEYTDCLRQSYCDLSGLFQQLSRAEKRRLHDVKEVLKCEVKTIIRDVKLRSTKSIFDDIKTMDEDLQSLLIDLNTQQFRLSAKIEEVARELCHFDSKTAEEHEQMMALFIQSAAVGSQEKPNDHQESTKSQAQSSPNGDAGTDAFQAAIQKVRDKDFTSKGRYQTTQDFTTPRDMASSLPEVGSSAAGEQPIKAKDADFQTPSRANEDNSPYQDQYFQLSKQSPRENAKRNSSQKNPAEKQIDDLQDSIAQNPTSKMATHTEQRLTQDREPGPHMRVPDSPFTSQSQQSSKLSEARPLDQRSMKEQLIRFEYLTQNGQEMAQCEELSDRVVRLFKDLSKLKSNLFRFIFSMNNTISVQAYVEPGQKEAQFFIEHVENPVLPTESCKNEPSGNVFGRGQPTPTNQLANQIGNETQYEGDGFTIMTECDQVSQRSFISHQSRQSTFRMVGQTTPLGGNVTTNSSMMSSGGHHKTIQKVNSILMKSLLEKLAKKLTAQHLELVDDTKHIQRVCLNYLSTQKSQGHPKESQRSPGVGFFAMAQSLSAAPNGLYHGQSKIFEGRRHLLAEFCHKTNLAQIQQSEALGAQINAVATGLKAVPSDIEVDNLSMIEYRESAQQFVKQCLRYVQEMQKIQTKVYSAKQIAENLQLFLVELRSLIGDADLIRFTDNIFQRVQLREIQKQTEHIQTQYKHIFNKIEQEMEQNAENDYGSDEEANEESGEQFSNEQLGKDREQITQKMSQNRKIMQQRAQMIESLSNKLQQAIIKTCSNKQMLKQVDIKYLTVYMRDTAVVQGKLDEWQDAVDQEAEEANQLAQKYQVVYDESLSNNKVLQSNFSLQPSAQVKFNSICLVQKQEQARHTSADPLKGPSRVLQMKDANSNTNGGTRSLSTYSKYSKDGNDMAQTLEKLRLLVSVYQRHYYNQKQMLSWSQEYLAEASEQKEKANIKDAVSECKDQLLNFSTDDNDMLDSAMGLTEGYKHSKVCEAKRKMYSLNNALAIVGQTLSNIEAAAAKTPEQQSPSPQQQLLKLRNQLKEFSIETLLSQQKTKINRLDKTKNILIKELQSLKCYCVTKLDRAAQETEEEKSYLSDEEMTKVREIIKKLDSYLDLIGSNLTAQISEQLHQRVKSISWVGLDNDYESQFQDLEDALSQLNNVIIGSFSVHFYLSSIKDSIQICQDIATRIKISKIKKDNDLVDLQNIIDNLDVNNEVHLRKKEAEFQIVDYFKVRIAELIKQECTEEDVQQKVLRKLSEIKQLTKHDFILSGKRFQIKQPPVLTISNSTKVTEIIVKVGVSSLNLKEFLLNIINDHIVEQMHNCDLSNSEAGTSHFSKFKAGSALSAGSSHYGLGLQKIRSRIRENAYEDIGSSPDTKMSRASNGAQTSNFDQSSVGSFGNSNPQLKLGGLTGLKLQSTQLGLNQSLKLNLTSIEPNQKAMERALTPNKTAFSPGTFKPANQLNNIQNDKNDVQSRNYYNDDNKKDLLLLPMSPAGQLSDNQNRFYNNRNAYKTKLLSKQSMQENEKSVKSGGSAYSKNSGVSKGSGLNGYNGLSNVAALLQPKTALEQIQEATGNYEGRLESLADCPDEQDVTDLSIDQGVEKEGAQAQGRKREVHILRPGTSDVTAVPEKNSQVSAIEQRLQQKLQSGQLGQFDTKTSSGGGASSQDKKAILKKPILQIKDLNLNSRIGKPQLALKELGALPQNKQERRLSAAQGSSGLHKTKY